MPVHILVTVHKADGLDQKVSLLSRKPSRVYVEMACGESRRYLKTRDIEDTAPRWNGSIPLEINDIEEPIHFRLRRHARFRLDPLIGVASISAKELISQSSVSTEGVAVHMNSSKKREQVSDPLIMWISAKSSDVKENTEAAIRSAQEAVDGSDVGKRVVEEVDSTSLLLDNLSSLSGKLGTVARVVVEDMGNLAKLHPYANLAWKACSLLYEAVQRQRMNDENLLSLVKVMNDMYSFVDDLEGLSDKITRLETVITRVLQQTTECAFFICDYVHRGFAGRVLEQVWKDQSVKIHEFVTAFRYLQNDLDSATLLHTTLITSKVSTNVDKLLESEYMKSLKPSMMDRAKRKPCLPGTRTQILDNITEWIINPDGNSDGEHTSILWLHGLAGSGKSTIATTIAQLFDDLDRQGAYLFFERSTSDPTTIIRTLAHQLAWYHPALCTEICESIKAKPSVAEGSLQDQFERLLRQPLTRASEKLTGPVVVVLDALDECGNEDSRREMLKILTENFPKLPSVFRFLVTSRPERDINLRLDRHPAVRPIKLAVGADEAVSDIRAYIWSEMRKVRDLNCLSDDWPQTKQVDRLTEYSEGLFIWVSTMSKLVGNASSPAVKLDKLLSGSSGYNIDGLDSLYATALRDCCPWDESDVDSWEHFRAVMTVILFSRVSLNDLATDQMLGLSKENSCRLILARLGCLLDYRPGHRILPLHASFRDYLTEKGRSGGKPWSLASVDPEYILAQCCLRVMLKQLHFNMGNIETSYKSNFKYFQASGREMGDTISPELRYACIHWPGHLSTALLDESLIQKLHRFSHEMLLFWIEVACLIDWDGVGNACSAIASLIEDYDEDLSVLWRDASSFWALMWDQDPSQIIRMFRLSVTNHIPHIYLSALPFTPTSSRIRSIYLPRFPNTVRLVTEEVLSSPIGTPATGNISHLAFSPDGSMLTSCYGDGAIHIRGTNDYVLLPEYRALRHPDGIRAAKFSQDNRCLCCLTKRGALVAWKGADRVDICPSGICDFDVCSLPSGEHVIASCVDGFIRAWLMEGLDVKVSLPTLEIPVADVPLGHLLVSRDGLVAVAIEAEKKVILVDSCSQQVPKTIDLFGKGESSPIMLAFSSDNEYLAIMLPRQGGYEIDVWQKNISNYRRHANFKFMTRDTVNDGTWLRHGHILCIAMSKLGVVLRRIDHHRIIAGPFHSGACCQVALSPDGKTLATGSMTGSVKIWDVEALLQSNKADPELLLSEGIESNHNAHPIQFVDELLKRDLRISTYGWISGRHSEKILWVSLEHEPEAALRCRCRKHPGLSCRGLKHAIGPWTRYDFSKFVHGERWTECYEGEAGRTEQVEGMK